MRGNPMERNFGIGSPMKKGHVDSKKAKDSATSVETKDSYNPKEREKFRGKLQKSLSTQYSRDQLSQKAINYLKGQHSESMRDLGSLDKTMKDKKTADKYREYYREQTGGKMPSKAVTKVNRAKDAESTKSIRGSKKPNVKQERELNPRKRK